MRHFTLHALVLLVLTQQGSWAADTTWVLEKSTLTYHVSHPLHQSEGVSHEARGKGICHEGLCKFLIAVPVKSFDSGDTNRDLHMLQVVRGAEFPLVTVRLAVPESGNFAAPIDSDLQIEFAGQTAHYKVPVQVIVQGTEAHVAGTVPATMSDFKITPPSLLGIACKNEMPVKFDMLWRH